MAVKDRDDYWWGLFGMDVRSVHDLAMCITTDMVPDDPYEVVSRHAQKHPLPAMNASGSIYDVPWWR